MKALRDAMLCRCNGCGRPIPVRYTGRMVHHRTTGRTNFVERYAHARRTCDASATNEWTPALFRVFWSGGKHFYVSIEEGK